jgi:methylglutaconyl-CoA hydratase
LEERLRYTTIVVADTAQTRKITLNRPERRNAISPEMQVELIAAMEDSEASGCRVIVLAGAGDAFCSGLDLSLLQGTKGKAAAEHREDAERIARLFRTLYELPVPTIAAVHGPAIAGGTGLAMICDFTLATPEARFGFTEARIGFVPALVSAFLSLQIGDKRSRDLLLTGRLFDAAEAFRLGLVHEVVASEDLATRVQALAESLEGNSPQALAATKRLLVAQDKVWLDAAIEMGLEANARARDTQDFGEGVAAFLEKRKPVWGTK